MTIQNRIRFILFTVFLTTVCLAAAPQQAVSPVPQAALSQAMPVDSEITIGQLPNGLRYYVRANKKPEKRAELRLAIKAGSILEDDDQQGLAHFVEHMAFNGTKNFPKSDLVSFIESLGMRFGAHLNAYTSFDETVYMLQVPTDKTEVIDKALQILEDWAHNVTFDPAEIDKERGVVMEEWRSSRGAGMRIVDKLFPVLLKGSRYGERLPIGKPEILQTAKPERLTQFYKDWYRPDMMAVVAVADFDKAVVDGMIKARFAPIPAATNPRPRPTYDLVDHEGTVFATATDKEMTATTIEVDNILPARKQGTVGVYRQDMVDRLFSGMLSARFAEMTQKPDAPFLGASVGRGSFFSRTKDQAMLMARVREDGLERGLDAVLAEAERVTRFGFTATELDRQKQNILRGYERSIAEKENRLSNSRADEYVRNFLQDEPLPPIEFEFALHQKFLPTVTLNEVNAIAKEWFPERNRFVVITAPDKPGMVIPDEPRLAAVIKSVPGKNLTAYVDNVSDAALLEPLPKPGAVVRTTTKEALGITEWELSNGVKVILKPTTFRDDEVVFRATSPGGTSLASDEDYVPASSAVQVVGAGGLGPFNMIDLRKALTGKVASANAFIGELEEGVAGSSSKKDLETMFQLLYLRFTQPRKDETAFGVLVNQMKTALANQTAVPEFAFQEALVSTLGQNHLRRRITTPATIDQWNLEKSMAFYKDRFSDAGDFTFVFVGSFDVATMKPLVERYLGSLPSNKRKESFKDVGARTPKGVMEKRVEKGIEPKSQNAIVFTGPFQYDPAHRIALGAMTRILQTRLLETIREELGGTYSISVGGNTQKNPQPEYSIAIQFGSDPQRSDALVKRVFEEIEKFKTNGPTEKQLTDQREALLREFETNSKQNNFWLSQILFKYQYGEDVAGILDAPEFYKKLDAATIQDAAKSYLNLENWVRVSLFPAKN